MAILGFVGHELQRQCRTCVPGARAVWTRHSRTRKNITGAGWSLVDCFPPPTMYHGNAIKLLAGQCSDNGGWVLTDPSSTGNSHMELAQAIAERWAS